MSNIILCVLVVAVLIYLSTYGWLPNHSIRKYELTSLEIDTRDYVKEVVHHLAEDIGTRNYEHYEALDETKDYIVAEFERFGYETELQSYSTRNKTFSNVIAKKSHIRGEEPIIIGAHYDSCFNPGADDNASGVAGILALARLFSQEKSVAPIIFVAFVNEEPPFFRTNSMGSIVYSNSLKQNGVEIKGAVILEMIGDYSEGLFSQKYLPLLGPFYPNRGNFIGVVGNSNSSRLVRGLKEGFKKSTRFPICTLIAPASIPGVSYSDHWSFWQEGYPAVMVTDTAFLRNRNYHKQSDLPATLNYEYMSVVLNNLKEAIAGGW